MNTLERIDPRELGRRLKIARTAARITQEQAAHRAALARTTLVAIEQGDRRVAAEELVGLCGLYNVEPGRLLRQETIHADLALQFRSTGSVNDAELLATLPLLQDLAARYVELEKQLGKPLAPAYPAPSGLREGNVDEQAEDSAAELRSHLGIGNTPIPDVLALLESELRIRVFVVPLNSRISGAYAHHPALDACILINANHPRTRQNWTAAHELGHFMSDRHTVEVMECDMPEDHGARAVPDHETTARHDRAPQPGPLPQGEGEQGRRAFHGSPSRNERFANAFASAFLMPAGAVRKRYRETCRHEGKFSARNLVYLASTFHVSPPAMSMRLERLGLFAKGTYEMLKQRGFFQSMANTVLGATELPAEKPAFLPRYTLIALEACEQALISEGELAKMLRIGRIEAREIMDSLTDFSEKVSEPELACA